MSYYKHHAFMCTNKRDDGRICCENAGASKLRAYAKAKIKALGISGKEGVRVNTAGCLDRCGMGPVMVVYPEEVWYHYENEGDIDEIIDSHFIGNKIVERLRIKER